MSGDFSGRFLIEILKISYVFGSLSGIRAKNEAMHSDEKASSFVPEPFESPLKILHYECPGLRFSL